MFSHPACSLFAFNRVTTSGEDVYENNFCSWCVTASDEMHFVLFFANSKYSTMWARVQWLRQWLGQALVADSNCQWQRKVECHRAVRKGESGRRLVTALHNQCNIIASLQIWTTLNATQPAATFDDIWSGYT